MSAAAVSQPHRDRSEADRVARAVRGRRLSLAVALLSGALGAAVVLLAGGRTWARGAAQVASGSLTRSASGQDITSLPGALAIVGLAALVAVFAVRRTGRIVVASVLALCGVGTVVSSVLGASDTGALEKKAADTTGLAHTAIHGVSHTAWPWVAMAGGVLLLCAGLLALLYGRHWPAMSGRYERPGQARPATPRRNRPRPTADPDRPEELWKALDRGEDPTQSGG